MDDMELLGPFNRILDDICSPEKLRIGDDRAMTAALEETGYLDALRAESDGGAGLSLAKAEPLIHALGARGAPASIALNMVARASPAPVSQNLSAVIHAVLISGAAEKLLNMSIEYANMRVQFGKPIGRQQAIQHQIAVLAQQCALVRIAAQYGCAQGLELGQDRAAVAKHTASNAVPIITSVAHAVHGAIGITQAFDLQLYTKQLIIWRLAAGSEGYWARLLGQSRLEDTASPSVDFVRRIE
jgi:acyl-CoA dehydrogenase